MRVGALRILVALGAVLLAIVAFTSPAMAQDVDPVKAIAIRVTDLLANPEGFDGLAITIEGELVGDYGMRRDGYMWTQLDDDSYARDAIVDGGPLAGPNIGVGIRMPSALAEGLDPPGGYRREGPLVWATGTWEYHDPDRGGESYLDVTGIEVVEAGRELEEGPDWLVVAGGLLLLAATAVVFVLRPRTTET